MKEALGYAITPNAFEYGWLDGTTNVDFAKKFNMFVSEFEMVNKQYYGVFTQLKVPECYVNIESYLQTVYELQDINTGCVDSNILCSICKLDGNVHKHFKEYLNTNQTYSKC